SRYPPPAPLFPYTTLFRSWRREVRAIPGDMIQRPPETRLEAGRCRKPGGGARQSRGIPSVHQSHLRRRSRETGGRPPRRAERERVEGVLHRRAFRGRNGQCLLPAARGLEGLWEVPEPQDLGRRDELRADSVF